MVWSPNDVKQKIQKTLNNTRTTTQKLTNNGFRNTKKHPIKRLFRNFKHFKSKIAYENNPTVENFEHLIEINWETLEWFYEQKTKGIIIRARARWHEHGERNSKYFLNLEKRNQVKKHIRKLVLTGSISTNPFDILNEQKRFYTDLYQSKTSDENKESVKTFLNKLSIPKLSEPEVKQSCEGEISLEECKDVLDSFQNNKSPGNDGLPIEFYKTCWDLISDSFKVILTNMVRCPALRGKL